MKNLEKLLKNCCHLSFDLDGTIVNSELLMERAWNTVIKETGISVPFTDYRRHLGKPFSTILENLKLKNLEKVITQIYFDYSVQFLSEVELNSDFSHVIEYLGSSHSKGYSWSIITGKPRRTASIICDKLNLHSDLLICGDDYFLGKPHPLCTQELKNFLGVSELQNVIYLGDMPVDLEFSQNSGMNFIRYGNNDCWADVNTGQDHIVQIDEWSLLAKHLKGCLN